MLMRFRRGEFDLNHLNSEAIQYAKENLLDLFSPIIPYEASNGFQFNSNGICITVGEGFVKGCGGVHGKDDFYLILSYCPCFSNNLKYEARVKAPEVNVVVLETLSVAIRRSHELYAELLLN